MQGSFVANAHRLRRGHWRCRTDKFPDVSRFCSGVPLDALPAREVLQCNSMTSATMYAMRMKAQRHHMLTRPLWLDLSLGFHLLSLCTCSLISTTSRKVTTLVTRATYLQSCIKVHSSCQEHQQGFQWKSRQLLQCSGCVLPPEITFSGCSRCRQISLGQFEPFPASPGRWRELHSRDAITVAADIDVCRVLY